MKLRTARPVARLREGRTDWYRIENAATDAPASVWIYDEIGYWGVTASDFVRDLTAITAPKITLHISSPGGEVFDGIAIYNAVKTHKATVDVSIDGLAASAASFIAMAGNTITIARNAQMMIHDASGLTIGNSRDMAEMATMLDRCSDNIADIYAQRAGGDVASWRALMRAETWYTASEAVAAGLADSVQGAGDDPELTNTWDLSVYAYAGRTKAPPPTIDLAPVRDEENHAASIRQAFKEALQ